MTDRKKQNYLLTQLVRGVPLEKIDTSWEAEDKQHRQEQRAREADSHSIR